MRIVIAVFPEWLGLGTGLLIQRLCDGTIQGLRVGAVAIRGPESLGSTPVLRPMAAGGGVMRGDSSPPSAPCHMQCRGVGRPSCDVWVGWEPPRTQHDHLQQHFLHQRHRAAWQLPPDHWAGRLLPGVCVGVGVGVGCSLCECWTARTGPAMVCMIGGMAVRSVLTAFVPPFPCHRSTTSPKWDFSSPSVLNRSESRGQWTRRSTLPCEWGRWCGMLGAAHGVGGGVGELIQRPTTARCAVTFGRVPPDHMQAAPAVWADRRPAVHVWRAGG